MCEVFHLCAVAVENHVMFFHSSNKLILLLLSILLFRKMPEKEADHLTPATRLLEKKREMAEVEQALQATKDVWII